MLLKYLPALCLVQICFSKSVDVTFKNVTFRGYAMYTLKFEKIIKSSNSLKDFLPEVYSDKIEITGQNVPVLYEDSLGDLAELDELVIEYSNVYEIRPGALRNVPMMRRLSLKGNNLEEIKSAVFTGLQLSTLDLSLNSITTISSSAFDQMPNLLNVNLADNFIKTWDKKWFAGTPLLSRISMQNNSLENLPRAAFVNLAGEKRYGKVDLSVNLVFSHNSITEIDLEAFKGLDKVNHLWLDYNLLETFHERILEGVDVKDLRIDHNKITCLVGNLGKILKAESNHIDSNPYECGCLETIKTWVKKNERVADYSFAEMECSAQRIKTKLKELEIYLKKIKGMENGEVAKENSDVELLD